MMRFDLRAKIAATLCVLILLAMLLIDLVFVATIRKERVQALIHRGRAGLAALASRLPDPGEGGVPETLGLFRESSGATAVVVLDGRHRPAVSGTLAEVGIDMVQAARTAAAEGRTDVQFAGETWGVFWKQARHAVVSVPYAGGGASWTGAAMAISFEGVYQSLRNTQKIFFVYLAVNGVLLTLLGSFRINQIAVRPVFRLLKRAESYPDDEPIHFMFEQRGENEFNRLSRALNRMLQRITEDRETLRETVRSLEQSNLNLKKAQNDIIQAEKLASVGRLSSGIAHEIGNPIGIVLGYLELMRQPDLPEAERAEYIGRAQDEINRISTIIRQLLDFSRPIGGDAQRISVHGVLADIMEVVRVQPLMAHVSVELRLEAAHDRMTADPNQLRQVFLNLIINAADAIGVPPDGRAGVLTVSSQNPAPESAEAGPDESTIMLRFVDNGPGISQEHMGNIFDPFFTTKAPGKGTGLGLSVCFMIIEKMGGRIAAESREQEGTVVTIYLPLDPGDEP